LSVAVVPVRSEAAVAVTLGAVTSGPPPLPPELEPDPPEHGLLGDWGELFEYVSCTCSVSTLPFSVYEQGSEWPLLSESLGGEIVPQTDVTLNTVVVT
jgi:hypothetical protein